MSEVRRMPNGMYEVKGSPGREFFQHGTNAPITVSKLKSGDIFSWTDAEKTSDGKLRTTVPRTMQVSVVFDDCVFASPLAKTRKPA